MIYVFRGFDGDDRVLVYDVERNHTWSWLYSTVCQAIQSGNIVDGVEVKTKGELSDEDTSKYEIENDIFLVFDIEMSLLN